MRGLAGAELVTAGLDDLRRGDATVEALLVSIGASRLRAVGLDVPEPLPEPELSLLYRFPAIDAGSFRRRVEDVPG